MKPTISRAAIGRLVLYFRALNLAQEKGMQIISSEDLGKLLDITPVQIRKDLALFGQFGMKGIGYFTGELINQIGNILGLNDHLNMAIVGVGHLGGALANYKNFEALGFKLVALFDKDVRVIGSIVHNIKISDVKNLKSIINSRNISIAAITVPVGEAQSIADLLVDAGVKGIWNFAPTKIIVPPDIHLVNEDLSMGLSTLSYLISKDQM
ncbi:MAG: redox-sensing transcriptional repressor Rex [Selenomonadaceae bacterium]|nr:redox-sensing transcriptional repressor Rex [Selenomonadaceae bacterium]